MPLPKTVATLFREITGKKVFVAGSFDSHRGGHAVRSAFKNADGLLFPTRYVVWHVVLVVVVVVYI